MKKSTKETRRKIDAHVGEQLRNLRNLRGLSQETLAAKVDLTFQQLQKYERGMNRISASVLYEFSLILEVPVARFYEGLQMPVYEPLPALNKEHLNLIHLYDTAPKPLRKDFLKILKAVGGKK